MAETFMDYRRATHKYNASAASIPKGSEWLIVPCEGDETKWIALKRNYRHDVDDFSWVPLSESFDSESAAIAAVKEYLARKQPIYLDCFGDKVTYG